MRAHVTRSFNDLKENVVRQPGEEFECSRERFDEVNGKLPGFLTEVRQPANKKRTTRAKSTRAKNTSQ